MNDEGDKEEWMNEDGEDNDDKEGDDDWLGDLR